ncbi:apolipoprotein N-acyltransferase [Fluviibacterium sp. DFM31]|uniref:Apolipoprotein N-acyltransferase n=1 Tax=Meridianimarinicoccus marinus TaxID=3231483 RepID=A0ABV3L1G3_9RHOB
MRAELSGRRLWLALTLCGAAAALGQAPFGWPLVALLPLAGGLGLALPAPTPRAGFWRGWALAFGYFLATLHWIVEPFLVDIARHGWMAPFALVLLAGGMALFWGGAAAAAVWLGRGAGLGHRVLALAATLPLAEMIRAVLFTGFPWGMLATFWTDTPVRMAAAWGGPYGLVALTVLAAGGLAVLLFERGAGLWRGAAGPAVLLAVWVGGAASLQALPPVAGDGPVVRVVQPNAPQHLKWQPDMIPVFWRRKLELTGQPGTLTPDVVVWPEVTLPYLWGSESEGNAQIARAAGGAVTLVGAQRFDGAELRNSVGVLDGEGQPLAVYDKFHLVPFGEYFPGGALAARLGLAGLATDMLGGFSSGPGPQVLDLRGQGLGRVLPLICYEAIFPRHGFAPGPRADWIVQVTNDAWFGEFAGPQQHLAQARMRAVEQGVPLVRAANTGISAVIGPAGQMLAEIPLGVAGVIDVALPAPLPPTLYSRTGNWPVLIAALGLTAGLGLRRVRGA